MMQSIKKRTMAIAYMMLCLNIMAQEPNNFCFPTQTTVENGVLVGAYDVRTGVQYYLGVPFAEPPVGELRWKAPQPVKNWQGVRKAVKFGPRPVQGLVFGDMHSRSAGMSEDCLYLNVWTPAKTGEKGLPVLVYFYGGGFVTGDGSEPRYDGTSMATNGIVVVTVNYRLNIFGLFAHPELIAETSYHGSGNYGLMDQDAALQWVRRNIAAFGGDPNRVTMAGESAGSVSVSIQMASPLTKGFVHGAIGESAASITPTSNAIPISQSEQLGVSFLKQLDVNKSISELRAMSTQEIWELYRKNPIDLPYTLDGYVLKKTVQETFESKEQSMVPLLVGWNSAELTGAVLMGGKPYTVENYQQVVKQLYPDDYDEVLRIYKADNSEEAERAITDIASDRFLVHSTWKWGDLHTRYSDQPVYRYIFSRIRPALVDNTLESALAGGTVRRTSNRPAPRAIGAAHASEIEYCMGNLPLSPEFAWTDDDYIVSKTMQQMFINFIKNG